MTITNNAQALLSRHPLFRSLSPEQLQRATQGASVIELTRNQHLFEQGSKAEFFYYLLEGQVTLSRFSPDGDEKIIEIVTPGSTFAEALMFMRAPFYPVAAQTLKDSRLIRINANNYYSLLSESASTCLNLLADLSQRLHGLVNEIDNLTLHNAACRIAGYLVTRAEVAGTEYELDIPKLALASRLAVKPETFSRIIKQLCLDDLIRMKGSRVHILDLNRLREFSQNCLLQEGSLTQSFHLPLADG